MNFFKKRSKKRYFLAFYTFSIEGGRVSGEGNIDISIKTGVVNKDTFRFIRKYTSENIRKTRGHGKYIEIKVLIVNLIEKDSV